MSFETVSPDPAVAAPIPAPAAPEGADLLVKSGPHDQSFWDRHPEVERFRVTMHPGQAQIEDWTVLVWLKPDAGEAEVTTPANGELPSRPADAEFVVHAAHDLAFFGRHPDLQAWQVGLALNEAGPGSVHYVQVWMTSPAAG
jgi:hypothetical protein